MNKVLIIFSCAAISLSGCMNSQQAPTQVQRNSQPAASLDTETLALSCGELQLRQGRIAKRLKDLEQEGKARAHTAAVTDTVVSAGLGALLGAGAQGGISGIRTASAAVQGIEAVRAAERGQESMSAVSDTLALAARSSELQRASIEKGC